MVSLFAEIEFFSFRPKTMDYNKAFWPKLSSFFMVHLLHSGRCYEAKICAIPLLLRCPFRWYPCFLNSVRSFFGLKHWTVVRRLQDCSCFCYNSSLEGATKLKFASFCSSLDALSDGIMFLEIEFFSFWPKTMDYNKAFWLKLSSHICALITPHWKVL